MNCKNMLHCTTMTMILPLAINAMNIVSSKKNFFSQHLFKRFKNSHTLREKIATPYFDLFETKKIINTMGHIDNNSRICLVKYVVDKAAEHKLHEEKYAGVLEQLRKRGWGCTCYVDVQLHSAVIADLPNVTEELLQHDKDWIHKIDSCGCIPLHYAQSFRVAKSLLVKGSKMDVKDKWGDTPLHKVPGPVVPLFFNGSKVNSDILAQHALLNAENSMLLRIPDYDWQTVTPLRKAVDVGDYDKCKELIYADIYGYVVGGRELNMLIVLANLRYKQTMYPKHLSVKELLSDYRRYHYEEKH